MSHGGPIAASWRTSDSFIAGKQDTDFTKLFELPPVKQSDSLQMHIHLRLASICMYSDERMIRTTLRQQTLSMALIQVP